MGVTREGSHDNITVLGNEVGVDDVVLVEDGGTRGDVSDDPDLLTILSGQSKSVLQESVLVSRIGDVFNLLVGGVLPEAVQNDDSELVINLEMRQEAKSVRAWCNNHPS